jgi:hypothetical protein
MKLRYAGTCWECGTAIAERVVAVYDPAAKKVTCTDCADGGTAPDPTPVMDPPLEPEVADVVVEEPDEVEVGVAGASARRQYETRQATDDKNVAAWVGRVRAKHPVLGGLMLAVAGTPVNHNTQAWKAGATGEEAFARSLGALAGTGLYFLHDRRIPPGKANIDHLVIAPTGVWVIDAKNYTGSPTLDVKGGIFGPRVEKLRVAGRDRTKLVTGVHGQMAKVRDVLTRAHLEVTVHGMLCFVDSTWPLIGGSFMIDGLHVVYPKKARQLISSSGPMGDDLMRALHRALADGFPPA